MHASTIWIVSAGNHWGLGVADGFQDAEGIEGGLGERSVAMSGADTQQIQRWVVDGEQYGAGVLGAR